MEISNLTFIITDDCNFNCSYCFQKKEKKTIKDSTIKTAVDFFYPFLKDNIYIGFYGGEPLLAYEKIKYATLLLLEKNKTGNKKIKFSVTTNGSLLTDEMLDFFNHNQFTVMLSFDGLAQDKGRKKGTLEQTLSMMKQLQTFPGIDLEINSVFSPRTISDFSTSVRYIIEHGGAAITINFSTHEEWNTEHLETLKKESQRLTDFLVLYKEKGIMPVKNFPVMGKKKKRKKNIFSCSAGRNRMAVTPKGNLWGCFLFHDYFKTRQENSQYHEYAFGTLTDFISNYQTLYPKIMANYSQLRQDFFQVEDNFCFLCQEVEECAICPVNAAYSTGSLGKISRQKCHLASETLF